MILILFLVHVSAGLFVQEESLSCTDWSYDFCEWPKYGNNGKQINVPDIETCLETCHNFGEEECKFIIFDNDPEEALNCEIRAQAMEDFTKTCKIEGQPLRNQQEQELNKGCSSSDCVLCSNCLDCLESPCVGVAGNDCSMDSAPQETIPGTSSYALCTVHCRILPGVMYAVFNYESHLCTCYPDGGRTCNKKMVKFGTDLSIC